MPMLQELDAASKKKAHLMLLQAQVEEREKARQAAKATRAAEGQAIKQQLELERSLIEASPILGRYSIICDQQAFFIAGS